MDHTIVDGDIQREEMNGHSKAVLLWSASFLCSEIKQEVHLVFK